MIQEIFPNCSQDTLFFCVLFVPIIVTILFMLYCYLTDDNDDDENNNAGGQKNIQRCSTIQTFTRF